jgi:hypothetical protein
MSKKGTTRRDFMTRTFQFAGAAALMGSMGSLPGLPISRAEAGGGKVVSAATGFSTEADPKKAGQEAAAMAKEQVKKPNLALVFADPPHKDFDAVLAGVTSVIGNNVRLVGQTTGYDGGYSICPAGCIPKSVAVMLIESDDLKVGIGLGTGIRENPREAAKKATMDALKDLNYNPWKQLQNVGPGPALAKHAPYTVLMMDDGAAGVVDYEIYGIQDVMGWAPLVGGCAGDDGSLEFQPLLFYRGKVYKDAIIITILSGPVKMGYGCGISYTPAPGKYGVVTKGDGFREIYEINGKNAFDVWLEWAGAPREEIVKAGRMFPHNQFHPIGVPESLYPDWIWIKDPFRYVEKEGNIIGIGVGGIVPVGTTVHSLDVSTKSVIEGNIKSLNSALNYEGISKVAAAIAFNCVERLTVLQTEEGKVTENYAAIMDVLGSPPIIGNAGAWGEQMFAPTGNIGAQNMTLCTLLIGDELVK